MKNCVFKGQGGGLFSVPQRDEGQILKGGMCEKDRPCPSHLCISSPILYVFSGLLCHYAYVCVLLYCMGTFQFTMIQDGHQHLPLLHAAWSTNISMLGAIALQCLYPLTYSSYNLHTDYKCFTTNWLV